MSRNSAKALVSFILTIFLFSQLYGAAKDANDVFFVADSMVLGNKGVSQYSSVLQNLFDKEYGSGKVAVYNYSLFDMNTSQSLRLIRNLLDKNKNTQYVIIMVGEANFYNLNGFADYLYSAGKYAPQPALISGSDYDAIEKLNIDIAGIYNSPLVSVRKTPVEYAASIAYRAVARQPSKIVNGYSAKIVPVFAVLLENGYLTQDASFYSKYRAAWNFINGGKYDKADALLGEMRADSPLNANVYYALGSLYLTDAVKKPDEALRMFESGILVNPFDESNRCYKGLAVMYMSYGGAISKEILYFASVLKNCVGEKIPEINAITAINSYDNDEKIAAVSKWLISDVKEINDLCVSNGARLIVSGYPLGAKAGALLKNAFSSGNILFVDNSGVQINSSSSKGGVYDKMAGNLFETLKAGMDKK
ncbi:MAG: hypothetical protein LBQ47_08200 [Endomicrobium sp.]|jgi:hypothetical protein|nr:hypothetical protein [Endomicrobium sp.]